MTKMRLPLYTQSKNSCAIETCFNILRSKYGILFNDDQREHCKQEAAASWIWSEESGTVFKFFYNWFTGYMYKHYKIELDVTTYTIPSENFDRSFELWEGYGLWLLYAWSWYREVREDWEITLEEIINTEKEDYKYYGHNLFWKKGYIVAILRSIDYEDKIIKLSKEALLKWVEKWFFYPTARSFRIRDSLLEYYLTELNKWSEFADISTMEQDHKDAIYRAIKLRGLYHEKK